MTFKVGQRVVAIRSAPIDFSGGDRVTAGDIGTVVAVSIDGWDYRVDWDRGQWSYTAAEAIRAIDDDSRDLGAWEAVREATGWHPQTVRAGA